MSRIKANHFQKPNKWVVIVFLFFYLPPGELIEWCMLSGKVGGKAKDKQTWVIIGKIHMNKSWLRGQVNSKQEDSRSWVCIYCLMRLNSATESCPMCLVRWQLRLFVNISMDLNRLVKTNKHPNFSLQAYSQDFDSFLLVNWNHDLKREALSGFVLNRIVLSRTNVFYIIFFYLCHIFW